MSRIHEALEKAERERGQAPSTFPQPPAARTVDTVKAPPDPVSLPGSIAPDVMGNTVEKFRRVSWNPDPERLLFCSENSQGEGREEYRTLRSSLYQLSQRRPLKKLVVASAVPGEGKSSVAANLAQAIALQGQRTLLIDADLRKPRLHELLGAPNAPGIAEYLRGEASTAEIMQVGSAENLLFIPAGSHTAGAGDLIVNGRFTTLLAQATAVFDWIIVDTPPVAAVADVLTIADLCDGVLLVLQAGSTPLDVVRRACRQLKAERLVGVVLNRLAMRSGPYYYPMYGGDKRGSKKHLTKN